MQAIAGVKGKTVAGYSFVYVGRGSPLGNPFVMHKESMRDEVCDNYQAHFDSKKRVDGSPVRKELMVLLQRMLNGEKLNLQCFCKPRCCHADTLAASLNRAYAARK